jgi:hypothetical protein
MTSAPSAAAAGSAARATVPIAVRICAALWLLIWTPSYAVVWGWPNFLHLCDVSVFLTCAGLLASNRLLLSSQALATVIPDALWALDTGAREFFGRNLTGGTEYMWDPRYPLWVRLLSLFHIALPIVLLWMLSRMGYDRRAFALQSAIAAAALVASRFTPQQQNINFVFRAPVVHRAFGPPAVHVAIVFAVAVLAMYWPTHKALAKLLPVAERARRQLS